MIASTKFFAHVGLLGAVVASAVACGGEGEERGALLSGDEQTVITTLESLATTPKEHCPPVGPLEQGRFNTPGDEGRIVFTPDGKSAYFHVSDENSIFSILESHFVGGSWTDPVVASFSGHDDFDPFVSSDGKQLWFSSWRGVNGDPSRPDTEIWYVKRKPNGTWGEPIHVGAPVSSPYWENFPSLTADGTLYFNTNRAAPTPNDFDGWDIYSAKRGRGGFAIPERLAGDLNTEEFWEFNPVPLAGGRVLVFGSVRDDGHGQADLYASIRLGGRWQPAFNLGPCVNTAEGEFHPSFSPARGALAFVRFKEEPLTFGDFYESGR